MMIDKISGTKPLTKVDLAKQQGISVYSLYYKPVKPQKDQFLKNQLSMYYLNISAMVTEG